VAPVQFDEVLDLSPFCFTPDDVSSPEKLEYRLVAVVMHHGRGFGSGHYTAYCYNPCAGNVFSVRKTCLYDSMQINTIVLVHFYPSI